MNSPTMTDDQFYLFWDGSLSQWQPAGFRDIAGHEYNCCEQYMMHQKALLFKDMLAAKMIMEAPTPKMQKSLGRQIRGFDNKLWEKHRFSIVWQGNFLRFMNNQDQLDFLLSTGDKIIVEASPYDAIWGAGIDMHHPDIKKPEKWPGLNLLGEVHMSLRRVLQSGKL